MKINCYDTFTDLREVILGSVNDSVLDCIDNPDKRTIMADVLAGVQEDLSTTQQILESFGVRVHRPCTDSDFSQQISTPWFDLRGHHLPMTPSDLLLAQANKIIITASADRTRFFEQVFYKSVFEYYQDSLVLSMPMPRLHDSLYHNVDSQHDYFNDDEPLIDAANIQLFGKDIFVTRSLTANQKGINWIKQAIGPQYRYHVMPDYMSGHIDSVFNILRPGLVFSNLDKHQLPDMFANWSVIQTVPDPVTSQQQFLTGNVQDDDFANTVLDVNVVCIDQHHVLVHEWMKENAVVRQLEQHGITPVFAPMRYSHFINQGLKCMIQDTVRAGNLEDYA